MLIDDIDDIFAHEPVPAPLPLRLFFWSGDISLPSRRCVGRRCRGATSPNMPLGIGAAMSIDLLFARRRMVSVLFILVNLFKLLKLYCNKV